MFSAMKVVSGTRFFLPYNLIHSLDDVEWDRLQALVLKEAIGGGEDWGKDGWTVDTRNGSELEDLLFTLLERWRNAQGT